MPRDQRLLPVSRGVAHAAVVATVARRRVEVEGYDPWRSRFALVQDAADLGRVHVRLEVDEGGDGRAVVRVRCRALDRVPRHLARMQTLLLASAVRAWLSAIVAEADRPPALLGPPGWYPEPFRVGVRRYWDGRDWTQWTWARDSLEPAARGPDAGWVVGHLAADGDSHLAVAVFPDRPWYPPPLVVPTPTSEAPAPPRHDTPSAATPAYRGALRFAFGVALVVALTIGLKGSLRSPSGSRLDDPRAAAPLSSLPLPPGADGGRAATPAVTTDPATAVLSSEDRAVGDTATYADGAKVRVVAVEAVVADAATDAAVARRNPAGTSVTMVDVEVCTGARRNQWAPGMITAVTAGGVRTTGQFTSRQSALGAGVMPPFRCQRGWVAVPTPWGAPAALEWVYPGSWQAARWAL